MWILPTRGRPDLAQRVFSLVPPTARGVVVIDTDETEEYSHLVLPTNWTRLVLDRMFLSQKLNAALADSPSEPWYGIINDDMLPVSKGWDTELPKIAGAWGIAWADDELNRRIGAAAFGGELIRALGWLSPPSQKHFFIDDVHELIARDLGIGRFCSEIKIPHLHFSSGKAAFDTTYAGRPSTGTDQQAFENWKVHEWPHIRSRIRAEIK